MHLNLETFKTSWLRFLLLACFIAAIILLMVLDYFNLESIPMFNQRGFYFDYTWKGRLFLLFFIWLLVLETFNQDQTTPMKTRPKNKIRTIASIVCALVPIVYIITVNFLGFGQTILDLGEAFRGEYWLATTADWEPILAGAWPLLVEYCVFAFSFLAATILAHGKTGLKNYGITLGLIVGITIVYGLDTLYPYGLLRPLQMIALPTAACAAAVLEIIGYNFSLSYIPGANTSPVIRLYEISPSVSVNVIWPCAGVHSLFLYTLIILLLFKKSDISGFRKLSYFIVGAIGTYVVNVLRIVTFFVILTNNGMADAVTFHDVHGELYSVVWILCYILLIVLIQHFELIEKTRHALHVLGCRLHLIKAVTPPV
jgi:thaumarchaeosortase